jgi:ribonuclease BN (tRNA processing enzyme)
VRITVVGSADAFSSAGRAHSAYLIESAGSGPVMVDFGASSQLRLMQLGVPTRALAGLVITHLHGDHVGGLPFMWIDGLYLNRREEPLPIVGPAGTRAKIEALLDVTYAHAERMSWLPHSITEILPGESTALAGLTVRAFAAAHMDPPDVPLCLRITDAAGKTVAFSGDTEPCDGLLEAADGADLLLAECTQLSPPAGRHTTWEDWRTLMPKVRARRLVLTHLGADVREAIPRLLTEAPAGVSLGFADDGDTYTL